MSDRHMLPPPFLWLAFVASGLAYAGWSNYTKQLDDEMFRLPADDDDSDKDDEEDEATKQRMTHFQNLRNYRGSIGALPIYKLREEVEESDEEEDEDQEEEENDGEEEKDEDVVEVEKAEDLVFEKAAESHPRTIRRQKSVDAMAPRAQIEGNDASQRDPKSLIPFSQPVASSRSSGDQSDPTQKLRSSSDGVGYSAHDRASSRSAAISDRDNPLPRGNVVAQSNSREVAEDIQRLLAPLTISLRDVQAAALEGSSRSRGEEEEVFAHGQNLSQAVTPKVFADPLSPSPVKAENSFGLPHGLHAGLELGAPIFLSELDNSAALSLDDESRQLDFSQELTELAEVLHRKSLLSQHPPSLQPETEPTPLPSTRHALDHGRHRSGPENRNGHSFPAAFFSPGADLSRSRDELSQLSAVTAESTLSCASSAVIYPPSDGSSSQRPLTDFLSASATSLSSTADALDARSVATASSAGSRSSRKSTLSQKERAAQTARREEKARRKAARAALAYVQELDSYIRERRDFYSPGYYFNVFKLFKGVHPPRELQLHTIKDFRRFLRGQAELFRLSSDQKSVELLALTPPVSLAPLPPPQSQSSPAPALAQRTTETRPAGPDEKVAAAEIFPARPTAAELTPAFYGFYHCVAKYCDKRWNSVRSLPNTFQLCPRCRSRVYPYQLRPLQEDDRDHDDSDDEYDEQEDARRRQERRRRRSEEFARKGLGPGGLSPPAVPGAVTTSRERRSLGAPGQQQQQLVLPLGVPLAESSLLGEAAADSSLIRSVSSVDQFFDYPHDLELSGDSHGSSGHLHTP